MQSDRANRIPIYAFDNPAQHKQLLQAAEILSYQIVSLGFDKRIVHKASHILNPVNAFTAQNKAWFSYSLAIRAKDVPLRIASLQKLMLMLDKGIEQIQEIRKARQSTGTSLQQSFIIERIHQLLIRLKVIVTILDPSVDVSTFAYTDYFRSVVESENTHNRLRSFLSSNFYYLANQITEHGSRTGEKYITNNRKEYYQFFRSAAIGGVIISFAAFIKMELGHLPLAPFWFSFFIGLNYAFAFVIIHLLHGTIATKQPALTASAIATSLDDTNPRSPSLYNLAITIGKVFRSQLASLIGNLVIVYPLTVLIAFMYHWLFGQHLVNPAKAASILVDVQPSVLNVWYAGVAAFLLFLSGIVTGYFDNMVIFGQIPERVKANGFFRRLFGAKKTIRLSKYIDKNLGALMGNIMLGFGLGFMLFFGHIFGLFLDIRHVTISTGFFGFASFATDFQYTPSQWAYYVSGLLAIAATNLLVSFSMALYVALKSRNIATSQLWPLWRLAFKYFFRYPKDFFFPPKRERLPQDLM